ncbi:alkyl sulfatase dimerization domain-containing protein, partial [uncultured Pseudacidovorax sp.]|uniref:alkyl sulfatase dimerization domain-containing protein n=1 Tax=uncultured Pseudacidovorax sp. TaxID=679313 RepID=UPI0025D0B651
RVLYGGAALIDSMPNVGTPLRTLRDPVRWANTLEQLAQLRPEVAVREFGPTLHGADRVQHVLMHTARALRWLRERTVALMNEGLNERQILAQLDYPEEIFVVDWLKPTYGDPGYVVRDIYRAENGWWDRNPTSLHPAAPDVAAREVGAAITDKAGVLARAAALASRGEWQLALHVVDLLATAEGEAAEFAEARRLKAAWLRERAGQVRSYVSRNLFLSSAERLEASVPALPGAG